ncbi:helix-turn-helix domain-containing protein [Granulicella aggregans]|uniref:helix-turn-helix domain-containing protein n=1 Tax=Granulicella aggregans TaxID=474949 RepID=UPI0021E081B3|nr:helix-turn-helix transcriptional regulator [Granulicella aggregans]
MNEESSNVILRALGSRIRELRTERGYSQEGFADHCGVHRTFMGTVERGESNLSFSNIAKVADTLGVSLSVLFLNIEEQARALAANASITARPASPKAFSKPGPKRVVR